MYILDLVITNPRGTFFDYILKFKLFFCMFAHSLQGYRTATLESHLSRLQRRDTTSSYVKPLKLSFPEECTSLVSLPLLKAQQRVLNSHKPQGIVLQLSCPCYFPSLMRTDLSRSNFSLYSGPGLLSVLQLLPKCYWMRQRHEAFGGRTGLTSCDNNV